VLRVHPAYVLDDEDHGLVDIWAAYRRDSMGGQGFLPFGGGFAEQPSALMAALQAMNAAEGQIRKRMKR
jgi:hypothetical protein